MSIQLSFSAAQRYVTSPRSYYLHYVLRLRPKELSSALFFGSAIDLGVNYMLQAKKDGKEIFIDIAQSVFSEAWNWGEVNGVRINLSEPSVIKYSKADYDESILTSEDKKSIETQGLDVSWVSLKRKGFMILEAYRDQILPRIKEVKFVKYADDSAGISEQLATYFEAPKEELKVDAVGFIVIPKKIRKQKLPLVPIEVVIGEISEKVVNETFEKYDDVLTGIRLGKFDCTRQDENGCCSAPWGCSYRRYCESNGKDLTGLIFHSERKK